MAAATVVAVDLGASSGRVMLGRVDAGQVDSGRIELEEVHRFPNAPVPLPHRAPTGSTGPTGPTGPKTTGLHWDAVGLFREVLTGLRKARERLREGERIESIGIDTWAVDYGLLDARGELLAVPYCYRDERTTRHVGRVHTLIAPQDLYARGGVQFLPFNTLYQLAAEPPERMAAARTMLLLPDLLAYWLTGESRAEVTNASTTGLLDATTRRWDRDLCAMLDIPARLLPPLVEPGDLIGTLLPDVAALTGLSPSTPVVAVGSHDTASAVVGVPADGEAFAYISCGTWSLVGLEVPEPVLTTAARDANFTNEGGVEGRIRFLRNVMGLWLLSETLRDWDRAGSPSALADVLAAAAALPPGGPVFDVDDPALVPPGGMPVRIEAALHRSGRRPPSDRPALVRSILDSLAIGHARAVDDAIRLTGRPVDVVHLVGGGSRNRLLCRLTARATSRPVLAGPVEATALGNALVQARAVGALTGDLAALRALLRHSLAHSSPLERYEPDLPSTPTTTGEIFS